MMGSKNLNPELEQRFLRFVRIEQMFGSIDQAGCQVLIVPAEHLDGVITFASSLGYHFIDGVHTGPAETDTEGVAKWLDIDGHKNFMILIPTKLPNWLMFLIANAGNYGIFNCSSGYSSTGQYRSLGDMSIVLLITEDAYPDFDRQRPDWLYRRTRSIGPINLMTSVL